MLLADTNVWLALALSKHQFHDAVRKWLTTCGPHEVVFCRSTQQSLLRLLTTRAVLAAYGIPPLSNQAAWSFYDRLIADERIVFVEEPSSLEAVWRKLSRGTSASPKLWTDAYLAAFAVAGGHRLVTTDQGFKQFKGLDLVGLCR
ncbi:MAG: TA system VapC family ribonuclease toxin [Pirellulales bacterium]